MSSGYAKPTEYKASFTDIACSLSLETKATASMPLYNTTHIISSELGARGNFCNKNGMCGYRSSTRFPADCISVKAPTKPTLSETTTTLGGVDRALPELILISAQDKAAAASAASVVATTAASVSVVATTAVPVATVVASVAVFMVLAAVAVTAAVAAVAAAVAAAAAATALVATVVAAVAAATAAVAAATASLLLRPADIVLCRSRSAYRAHADL
jgi:hypothetical protein